jgi:hypothetical protein|tara:strand:+ start:594 stop:716 length:123 start_codon:yes stop_codon:yes gene_type:complete
MTTDTINLLTDITHDNLITLLMYIGEQHVDETIEEMESEE